MKIESAVATGTAMMTPIIPRNVNPINIDRIMMIGLRPTAFFMMIGTMTLFSNCGMRMYRRNTQSAWAGEGLNPMRRAGTMAMNGPTTGMSSVMAAIKARVSAYSTLSKESPAKVKTPITSMSLTCPRSQYPMFSLMAVLFCKM
ncbi:MAG: hypothetical protein WCW30_01730 [Candidatus Gracilibacteria bacterium]